MPFWERAAPTRLHSFKPGSPAWGSGRFILSDTEARAASSATGITVSVGALSAEFLVDLLGRGNRVDR
eukprot:6687042-Lingulodinium_polyedra.AAC.1